ncbi:jg3035, partial [Pararge aegeria aegeria]
VTHAPPPLPQEPQRQRAPMIPPREFLMEYIIPRVMVPQYLGYDEKLHIPRPLKNTFLDRRQLRPSEINMVVVAVTHAPPPLPQEPQRQRAPMIPPREFLMEYIIPRVMVPQYLGYDEKLHIPRPLKNTFLDRVSFFAYLA